MGRAPTGRRVERRLKGALGRDEISIHYQPIVRLRDHSIAGFEALARWRNNDEPVPADQWIPVAESTGLIDEIGDFVLQTAAAQLTPGNPCSAASG